MKCAACGDNFNDGVFCSGCNRHLDFGCASIGEVGYRRLGRERQASWRCPQCKISGSKSGPTVTCPTSCPADAPSSPVTLDLVFQEIQVMKKHLSALPTLIETVESIKNELLDLKTSCEFNSAKIDEFENKLTRVEVMSSELQGVNDRLNSTTKDIVMVLMQDNTRREQWARLNNVEIKGVPIKKDENLFFILENLSKAIGYRFPKTQINYVARMSSWPLQDLKKTITGSELGFGDSALKIFVNDHLTAENKKLLTMVKSIAKEKNVSYVWVKHSKIHVRKNDTSPVHIIGKESDLNKIL
ncbi:unnamed protein product [Euphydryas editha]|uniref:FP protein C-terminal domain-containing protein n=1 Tax=Euphydryas editha TaxID=104508 RepID=A0AAU9V4T8_EUPED|nr:unnamed protein product [Euphydryas editha]